MKHKMKLLHIIIVIILVEVVSFGIASESNSNPTPIPTPWPDQFHALLYMNLSTTRLQLSDVWYDWPKRRNVNIFQKQLATSLLYDIEWNNGTSFYFTDYNCSIMDFEVGIPRPDFLDGAVYLGTRVTSGFLCNLWEKEQFIWYYEDVVTKTPVRWDFYDGIQSHVMFFEVGAVLPDSVVQAPEYCFSDGQTLDRDEYTFEFEKHLRHRIWPTRQTW